MITISVPKPIKSTIHLYDNKHKQLGILRPRSIKGYLGNGALFGARFRERHLHRRDILKHYPKTTCNIARINRLVTECKRLNLIIETQKSK